MPSDGATFPRLHVWSSNEVILPVDLNAEFDNVLNNFTFEGLDDYELNVNQMRLQTSPGGVGSEVLATSGAGEIERIRFVLARALGTTYWYEGAPISLTQANALLNSVINIPMSRLDSGVSVPLLASATLNSVTLDGAPTAFQYHIDGVAYSVTADVAFAGLTLGSAAASAKALVNDTSLTAQESSKLIGENGSALVFDTDGTHTAVDIVARIGKLSAFRIVHGGNTEYFIATPAAALSASLTYKDLTFSALTPGAAGNLITLAMTFGATAGAEVVTVVGTAVSIQIADGVSTATQIKTKLDAFPAAAALLVTTISGTAGNAQTVTGFPIALSGGLDQRLSDARRGYFFDSSALPIQRIAIADEDVITLISLAYVFVTSGGALAVTYNAPTYSATQPAIAFAGDYWFDFTAQSWKTFNGSVWATANAVFLGLAAQNDVKTVGTRSAEYFAGYSEVGTIRLALLDSTHVIGAEIGEQINVAGHTFGWATSVPLWASSGQFAPGASLLPNTTYYAYVTNTGALLLDVIAPYDRTKDLFGFYHPYNAWRAVGSFATNVSSAFAAPQTYSNSGSGQGAFNKIIGAQIAPLAITKDKVAPMQVSAVAGVGGLAMSSPLASFTTSTFVRTVILTVTLTTTGRPVRIECMGDNVSSSFFSWAGIDVNTGMIIEIARDASIISAQFTGGVGIGNTGKIPGSAIATIDTPPPGTYVYTVGIRNASAGTTAVSVASIKLAAYEL